MVKGKCFKGSQWQSLFVAFIFGYHRRRQSFYRMIDRYICLNDAQISLLEKAGFDRKRIVKKYNFLPEPSVSPAFFSELPARYVVYYGRLGEEKGIRQLMEIWDKLSGIPLVVMGDGPLTDEFQSWASGKPEIIYLGYTPHETCLNIVRHAEFTVFPSIWLEGCSMVQIEAESLGKAIVAFDLGFSSESVRDSITGYLLPPGDIEHFAERIITLWNDPIQCRKLGENARSDYEKRYQPEENYRVLMTIYSETKKEYE
jgi:glycosyltransferase involved in cell wall biosynthesis